MHVVRGLSAVEANGDWDNQSDGQNVFVKTCLQRHFALPTIKLHENLLLDQILPAQMSSPVRRTWASVAESRKHDPACATHCNWERSRENRRKHSANRALPSVREQTHPHKRRKASVTGYKLPYRGVLSRNFFSEHNTE